MRVCVVTPYDLSCDGGVNRHVLSLAQALRRRGDRVRVLGPASGAVPSKTFGLPGVVSLTANGSVAPVGLLVSRSAVRRYLWAGQFDVIHVHEPWLPGIAHHAVRSGAAPVVGTFHCYADTQTLAVRVVRRALGQAVRRMYAGIAVSPAAAEFARTVFRGPTYLVPNGVDTAGFSPCHSEPERQASLDGAAVSQRGPLRVLFVGRYGDTRKGLRYLLDAAARLRAAGRALEVRVAGAGDTFPDSSLARAANATFLGRLNDADLANAYRSADVLCAPSIHGESFGLVLIEAMACGCPVIASDIRGYRDAAASAAFLVPPRSAASLAVAIGRVFDDVVLRNELTARGHRRAHALSWDTLVRDVRDLYLLAPGFSDGRLVGASA